MAATQGLKPQTAAHGAKLVDDSSGPGTARLKRQRELYGGLRWRACFCGWCASLGVAALLVGLVAAAAAAYRYWHGGGAFTQHAALVAVVAAACVVCSLAIAYYTGGYVAGRMARFDGGMQGLGVWLWGIAMAVVVGCAVVLFVVSYNLYDSITLPRIPLTQSELTVGGAIVLGVSLAATLGAAVLGGKRGVHLHRKVDEVP